MVAAPALSAVNNGGSVEANRTEQVWWQDLVASPP